MKLIISILILLSISFNVHSDTESPTWKPPWKTSQIFCRYIDEEVRLDMYKYNLHKIKIMDLNELIDNKVSVEGDDYYETREYKTLKVQIESLNETRFKRILPRIETYANIEGVFCRD